MEKGIRNITKGAADRAKQRIHVNNAFPAVLIENYQDYKRGPRRMSSNDNHALAAATATAAPVIAADNLKDFDSDVLVVYLHPQSVRIASSWML